MILGVRAKRAVSSLLADLGSDSRITRTIVRRMCHQRGVDCTYEADFLALRQGNTEIRLRLDQALFAPYVSAQFKTFSESVDATGSPSQSLLDFSRPGVHRYRQLDAEFELPSFPEAINFDDEYFRHGRPAPGALVFDIGANVGLVTHALSRVVGTNGRVVSLEPDPTSLEYLRRNNARHELANVEVVPAAVADTRGTLSFFAEGTITSGLASTRKEAVIPKSLGGVIDCDAITLRDAFERYGTPSWIKMDIEGAEIDVLAQSRDLLRETRPFLVIDTSHIVGSDTSAERVERILRDAGYEAVTDTPGGSQLTWAAHGGFTA